MQIAAAKHSHLTTVRVSSFSEEDHILQCKPTIPKQSLPNINKYNAPNSRRRIQIFSAATTIVVVIFVAAWTLGHLFLLMTIAQLLVSLHAPPELLCSSFHFNGFNLSLKVRIQLLVYFEFRQTTRMLVVGVLIYNLQQLDPAAQARPARE